MKQRTLQKEVSIKGKSLHTGQEVHLTLKPAPANSGYVFRRVDLYGKPEVKPGVDVVEDKLVRSTDISSGAAKVHTIEHVLSALRGSGVDNCVIELDASEPPILDGSAKHFVNLIQQAEIVEQDAPRVFIELTEAVSVTEGNRSLIALPYNGFKVTCTSADDRGIHTQHLSIELDHPEDYIASIAPARTFTVYEDIEPLIKMGKIQGGSLDSAIVLKGDKILSKEPLRFEDELVRHKILDIVGDLTLLGGQLKAHIIAVRPGHALNASLCRAIKAKLLKQDEDRREAAKKSRSRTVAPTETALDIRRVLDILPHRYPFILIDRVISITEGQELVAIKNVTINEPFFMGHFPGRPVMPGVLQLEAMAQAAGVLMLRHISGEGKLAFFMSADKVKFRRAVVPGDQLEITVKLTKNRGNKIAQAEGVCKVGGKEVSSADLMFTIIDDVEEN